MEAAIATEADEKQEPYRQSSSPRCERKPRPADLAAAARAAVPRLPDEPLSVAAAASAVNLRDLRELRSFRNPPTVVCQVFEAVAVILGEAEATWVKTKRLLDGGFLGRIRSYDPATTSRAQAERIAELLGRPAFSDGALGERCPPVLALAAWCNAVGRELAAAQSPPPAEAVGAAAAPTPPVLQAAIGGAPGAAARPRSEAPPPSRSDVGGLEVQPDLWALAEVELAQVHEFTVSRKGIGKVTFHGRTDCRPFAEGSECLDEVVILRPGEVVVYPDQEMKPYVGNGLNKPATITLYGCLPKAKGSWDRKAREKYRSRVKQMTEVKGAEFIEYDCDQGVWQFRVPHF